MAKRPCADEVKVSKKRKENDVQRVDIPIRNCSFRHWPEGLGFHSTVEVQAAIPKRGFTAIISTSHTHTKHLLN